MAHITLSPTQGSHRRLLCNFTQARRGGDSPPAICRRTDLSSTGMFLLLQWSLFPRVPSPVLLQSSSTDAARSWSQEGGAHIGGWGCDVFPVESQDSMSAPVLELEKGGEGRGAGDGQRYEVCFEATSGRTRRCVFSWSQSCFIRSC